ncbi:MAG: hypothetical protein V4751_03325 [Pseudomonadota bacterium]
MSDFIARFIAVLRVALRWNTTALLLFVSTSVVAADNPSYSSQAKQLLVPAVDSAAQPGFFQDVKIEFVQGDLWRLVTAQESVRITNAIERVELIKTDSFPVQIFLKVSGIFTSGCPEVGQISQLLEGNSFNVAVYLKNSMWLLHPELVDCAAVMVPFSRTIPLPVYGLSAGEYAYRVNDEHQGSFRLAVDNRL